MPSFELTLSVGVNPDFLILLRREWDFDAESEHEQIAQLIRDCADFISELAKAEPDEEEGTT